MRVAEDRAPLVEPIARRFETNAYQFDQSEIKTSEGTTARMYPLSLVVEGHKHR